MNKTISEIEIKPVEYQEIVVSGSLVPLQILLRDTDREEAEYILISTVCEEDTPSRYVLKLKALYDGEVLENTKHNPNYGSVEGYSYVYLNSTCENNEEILSWAYHIDKRLNK